MTAHAQERLTERAPDTDVGIEFAKDALARGAVRHVSDGIKKDHWIGEFYLPDGLPLYPVIAPDGSILTFLSEGMTAETPTGRQIIERLPYPSETISGLTVLNVPENAKILYPGAYRLSMERYHSQSICPGPSVSSTGIRKAALESPHAFWKTFDGNPDRYPEKEASENLILGRAAHALILGDEVFDEHFIYVPKDAPRRPSATQVKAFERDGEWSEAATPGAKFWAEFDEKAKGRLLLKEEWVQKIMWMAENLNANPLAVEVLKSDLIEISLIWQDDATGLWLKSRPDCIPSNAHDFGDLKTFSPKSKDLRLSVQRSITDFGYALQMALAVMGAEQVLGATAANCALVFCQTSEPYEVIPVILDLDTLYWARVLIRDGLNKIRHGLDTGDWPGVGAEMLRYEYPPSMTDRLSQLQADGELPNV